MNNIREVINELRKEIYKYPNVVGISLTPKKKIVKGKQTDIDCVRVYVSRKVPEDKLRKDEVIPKEVNGVKTDVVEIGKIKFLQVYTSRYRPVPAGVSVSRADMYARGTLGWFVIDEDYEIHVISNNHVFANVNQGKPGDKIVQPGLLDGGDPLLDVVFELEDYVQLKESPELNKVDLAWAKPISNDIYCVGIIEHSTPIGAGDPELNKTVWKVGASSGYTKARVIDESAEIEVEYNGKKFRFTDVAIAQGYTFVLPGDSGSPVIDSEYNFVGLIFAGSEDYRTGIFCKTSNIVDEMQKKMGKKVKIFTYNTYPAYKPYEKTVLKPFHEYTLADVLMYLVGFFAILAALFRRRR